MTWTERVNNAIQRGYFSEDDKQLADDWATCPCGGQNSQILLSKEGWPKDDELTWQCAFFYDFVCCNDFVKARNMLIMIDKRIAVVLAKTPFDHVIVTDNGC
jgi:hypothetical protein